MSKKTKKLWAPNVYSLLFLLAVFAAILTWIIPAGSFERQTVDNVTEVIPGTFAFTEMQGQNPWDVFQAIVTGFKNQVSLILMILFVGAAVNMLAGTKSYVGAVESYPDVHDEIKRLKHAKVEKVYMQPLMMVAGNHAHNDMASDQPNSWKTVLKENDIVGHPVLKGLGEYEEIQEMFIAKLRTTIERG